MLGARWWLIAVVAACSERAAPSPSLEAQRGRASPMAERGSAAGDDCAVDDDCELLPVVTCCGECAPSPPFESVPRAAIDALLLETEERCLRDDRPCPACARPRRGCTASAFCAQGRCRFTTIGCDFPNI